MRKNVFFKASLFLITCLLLCFAFQGTQATEMNQLSINDVTQNEGNAGTTSFTFTVSLSAPAGPGGVTFDIATANNTALSSIDYTPQSLTGQTIPAGSSTYIFTVLILGDTTAEANESFFVNVTNVTGADASDGQGAGTIENDDPPNLTISDETTIEGNSGGTTNATCVVSLSAPAGPGGVTFDIATADGTATAPSDYTAMSLTGQTIPQGSTTYSFYVPVNCDTSIEANENLSVNITNVTGAIVTDAQANVDIINDDYPALTINDVTVNEGNLGTAAFNLTVSLSSPAGPGGVTFDIATADGTAVLPDDYTAKSLTGQTIPAGASTYTFTVHANGDTAIEANESFFVNVTNVTGASVSDGQGTGTITNDDFPNLTISDATIVEGSSAGTKTIYFSISLSAPAGPGGITFDVATADGTAASPSDYEVKSLTGLTGPAGSSSYAFGVVVNCDTDIEADESFTVNITNVTGANVLDGQGLGLITNDDFPALAINDVTVNEGNSGTTALTFTVSLSAPAGPGGVTFDIDTANGTAVSPADYTAKSLTSQAIAEGESAFTFTVLANGDTAVEANESFSVNITNVSGATVSDGQGLGTITNDDATALTISDVTVNEGNAGTASAAFTVSLSSPAGPGGVTFDIATANGTALSPADYTAKSLTGQTIIEGESTYTFTVLVNGDTAIEAGESFSVNITNVSGATVSDGQGLGTITNDDADITAPTAGGNGLITASNAKVNAINLSWLAGSDADTTPSNLQYKVVRSLKNNIGTVSLAEANGTAITDWTYNTTGKTATGLKSSTKYYFNVIVKDAAGNKTVYQTVSKTTLTPSAASDVPSAEQNTVSVFVNGKEYSGTETKTTEDGLSVGTVALSKEFIDGKMKDAIQGNSNATDNQIEILVPDNDTQVTAFVLTGDTLQTLVAHSFMLSFENGPVRYHLPAKDLDIINAAKELGITEESLQLVQISIKITKLDSMMEKVPTIVQADGYKLTVPPVKIEITAQAKQPDGSVSTVEITKLSSEAQVILSIPDGVALKNAVVIAFFPDDTYQPVSAEAFEENGKWYMRFSPIENACFAVASRN